VEIPFLNQQYKGVAEDFEHCSYGFGTWKSRRTPESFDGEPSFACKNVASWWVNPEILNFNPQRWIAIIEKSAGNLHIRMEKGESHHDFPLYNNQLNDGQGFLREDGFLAARGFFRSRSGIARQVVHSNDPCWESENRIRWVAKSRMTIPVD